MFLFLFFFYLAAFSSVLRRGGKREILLGPFPAGSRPGSRENLSFSTVKEKSVSEKLAFHACINSVRVGLHCAHLGLEVCTEHVHVWHNVLFYYI